jgi:hypothetical protein
MQKCKNMSHFSGLIPLMNSGAEQYAASIQKYFDEIRI